MSKRILKILRGTAGLMALFFFASGPAGFSQSSSEVFDPNADGNVYAMLRQPDGKLIVAGGFHFLNPNGVGVAWDRGRIARLSPDGTVDAGFWAEFDGKVTSIGLLPDGKVLAAGSFTTVRSLTSQEPVPRNGFARLNANGSLDLSFDPNPIGESFPQPLVRAMVIQPDGKIVIAGAFTALQPGDAASPVLRNRLARINPDGTVDSTFDPNANALVLALALQRDGKLVVGGGFSAFQPNGAAAPVGTGRLARLHTDGTVDTGFVVEPDNRVTRLALQADGSILVAGDFLHLEAGGQPEVTQPRLARLKADGSIDANFHAIPNSAVSVMTVQADGKILIGGRFNFIYSPKTKTSTARSFIARLNPDGTVDGQFATFPNAEVSAFVAQPDGSIVMGGYFNRVFGTGAATSVQRNFLARLQPNGAVDAAFTNATNGAINSMSRLPEGGLVLAGGFNSFVGVSRNGIVKLLPDATVDPAFDPEFNNLVDVVVRQPDGKLLVGGQFTKIGTEDRRFLARLNEDGTLDTAFDPDPNSAVSAIAMQADGKIIIGGQFTSVAPNGAAEPTTRNFIARLNADGTLDTAFDPNAGNIVQAIEIQSDGKILIGGFFTAMRPNQAGDSVARSYFAKLNADGTLDDSLNLAFSSVVTDIALQADGKFIVGGSFTALRAHGATETSERLSLARFNADGSLDQAFDPRPDRVVNDVAVLPDGRIVIAGAFSTLQPNGAENLISRQGFAWLEADGTSPDTLAFKFNAEVTSFLAEADGVLVGGRFNQVVDPTGSGVEIGSGVARLGLDGTLDTTFSPSAGGAVSGHIGAVSVQPDGKIVLGGSFSRIAGSANTNLVRVGSDGSPDSGFFAKPDGAVNAVLSLVEDETAVALGGPAAQFAAEGTLLPGFSLSPLSQVSGSVLALARQPDGKLLVGGSLINSGGPGQNLLRFNADGTQDTTFDPGPNGLVRAIVIQADGKIVIGGNFLQVAGQDRSRMARVNADGTLDTAYDPKPNSTVNDLHLLDDGRVLAIGAFGGFAPNGATETTNRQFIARINADGTLDTAFAPTPNAAVNALVPDAEGRWVIGGDFSSVGGVSKFFLARLNADGGLDESFDPRPNAPVRTVRIQSDGRILAGGDFTVLQPGGTANSAAEIVARRHIVRLNTGGTIETGFDPNPNSLVNAIAIQADGRILVGGQFTFFLPDPDGDAIIRNSLARLSADGALDPTFNPLPNGQIQTLEVFANGDFATGGSYTALFPLASLLIGGEFSNFSETPSPYLARVFSNGVAVSSFVDVPDAPVFALAAQPDRAVIVAGEFTRIGAADRNRIARFSPDGSLDAAFDPDADGTVRTALVLPDGGIMIGGEFTTVGGAAAGGIALLNAAGVADAAFSATLDGAVNAIVQLSDGKFLVAGSFTNVNQIARPYLARLNGDGSLDGAYNPAPDGPVWSLGLQGNGDVIVGGEFTQIGGSISRGLARLNPDGSFDGSLRAPTNAAVYAVAPQFDGSIIVGGTFTEIGDRSRSLFAKLAPTVGASRAFSVSDALDAVTFSIGGSAGDLGTVDISFSEDSDTWTSLGSAQRTGEPGQWKLDGLDLPPDEFFYVRAEGLVATSRFASGSSLEVIAQFFGSQPATGTSVGTGTGGESGDGGNGGSSGSGGDSGGSGIAGNGNGSGSGGSGSTDGGASSAMPFGVVNLSGRGVPSADAPLITGFIVSGDGPQQVLLRAVGPGLAPLGVNHALTQPRMQLFDQTGGLITTVSAWGGSAELIAVFESVGAFALDPAMADAAQVVILQPGAYTVHVSDAAGAAGIALGEVYIAPGKTGETGRLANVSLRGPVGSGDEVLVAGFHVDSQEPRSLLIRGLGPALADFGVAHAVSDPILRVFDADGALVAENDDWDLQVFHSMSEVKDCMTAASAFPLSPGSADAAVLATLPAGIYTIQISSGTPGTALIEVYDAP